MSVRPLFRTGAGPFPMSLSETNIHYLCCLSLLTGPPHTSALTTNVEHAHCSDVHQCECLSNPLGMGSTLRKPTMSSMADLLHAVSPLLACGPCWGGGAQALGARVFAFYSRCQQGSPYSAQCTLQSAPVRKPMMICDAFMVCTHDMKCTIYACMT